MRTLSVAAPRCFLALIVVVAASCSNPRGAVISSDPEKWSTELKPAIEKLPEEDRGLLAQYLLRAKMGEVFGGGRGIPAGMTVGKAIEEQRAFLRDQEVKEAEAKAVAEKARRERAAQLAVVNQAVTVGLVDKGFRKADYTDGSFQDVITMVLAFENKTAKDIAGVKGTAVFADLFGDTIATIRLSYDKTIPAGKTIRWLAQTDYNQFLDRDVKLRETELGKLKFVFEPLMIVFTDGSKLEVPSDS